MGYSKKIPIPSDKLQQQQQVESWRRSLGEKTQGNFFKKFNGWQWSQGTSEIKQGNVIRVVEISHTSPWSESRCVYRKDIHQGHATSASCLSPSQRREILSPHHVCWLLPKTGLSNRAALVSSVVTKRKAIKNKRGVQQVETIWLSLTHERQLPDPTMSFPLKERCLFWRKSLLKHVLQVNLLNVNK